MSEHVFDPVTFRAQFPAFADPTKYPDEMLSGYFDAAKCFVSPYDNCWFRGDCLQTLLYLMTAHLVAVYTDINKGRGRIGIVTSSTIDRVSVTLQVPASRSAWASFLLLSPYGLELLALLDARAVGGLYVGGRPERAAFRKVFGRF